LYYSGELKKSRKYKREGVTVLIFYGRMGFAMCGRRFLCFVMSAFVLGLIIGNVASGVDVTTPRALSVGETYRITVDGYTGDEATTQPKTDANDGLNGDNIYYQRHNVARAHVFWYTSNHQEPGEPDPSGEQWVDYKPPLGILGTGIYSIEGEYRCTENRATYDVPYMIHHAGGTTTVYQNQSVGVDPEYYTIALGTYDLGEDGWVRVEDPGPNSVGFNRMRFTYLGSSSGLVVNVEADPASGDAPLTVNFDASGSYDSDGTIVSYEWDFTDDGTYDENNATATTSHVYSTKGFYQCRLRVTDNESNTAEAVVTIEVSITFEDFAIAHWRLDDNAASTTVVDSGSSGLNGTFVDATGNPNTSAHHSATCQEGSGSLIFDGVDDYVTMTRNSVLETGNATTKQLAVSAWIKHDLTSPPTIYTAIVGTGDGGWYIGSFPNENKLYFACWLTSGYTAVVTDNTPVFDGQWHHVVAAYDGSKVHIYVDGNHGEATYSSGTIRNMFDMPVLIGDNAHWLGRCWDGLVDDVRIYDKAPSEQDIYHMYHPNNAWNPSPADGAVSVDESSVTLSWSAGDSALTHDVYFGTSESLVTSRDASVYEGNVSITTHSVGAIAEGTDYFWAVDEVNGANPESPWLGEVWTFKTSFGAGSLGTSASGHYVTYGGQTLMLTGDSGTQCAAQNSNLDHREWIDDCYDRGIRTIHVWTFIPARQKQDGTVKEDRWGYVFPDVMPWARNTSGSLALDQKYDWNLQAFDEGAEGDFTHYWPRMRDLCSYAKDKNIIVGITMFTGWAKPGQDPWDYHPLNTTNGGHLTSAGDAVTIASPGTEVWQETYSGTWSNAKKTQWVWEKLSIKIIDDLGSMGNVFFVFFDEHSYDDGNMETHFRDVFKSRGMVWVDEEDVRSTIDWVMSATLSNYTDKNSIAVNGFMTTPVRPYFNLEGAPYMGDGVRTGIWTFSIGGGHYIFHADCDQETVRTGIMGYDPYVPGGDKGMYKRDWVGYASRFFNEYVSDLDSMTPWNSLVGSGSYCLAQPGTEYAVYSKSSYSTITVNLSAAAGKTLDCRFYDPRDGLFNATFQRTGGSSSESFTKPSSDDWVLHIIATSGGVVPLIAEVSPDPDTNAVAGVEYSKQLQLTQGTTPVTWSVVQGPAGIEVSSSGYVDNWIPGGCDVGEPVTIEIRAQNGYGSDTETWQVSPAVYYMQGGIANLNDLMMMAEEWLMTSGVMATDLDCSGGVDLVDFAMLGDVWLEVPAPGQATNPSPANGLSNVDIDDNLSWTAGAGATSHNVYFGTTSPGTYRGNQAGTTYEPGTMLNSTTYYWRIDEVNAGGTTTGAVWSFTTESLNPDLVISGLSPASYAVSYNNLNVGSVIYVDRTFTYTAVPAGYQGKTYIKTSNDDKDGVPNNSISFTVNRAVTVYVAHDDRIVTKPSWMSTFTNTGDDLVSSSESVHMSLYSKTFPAGVITLGANEGNQPNCSMYTVVVIEQ